MTVRIGIGVAEGAIRAVAVRQGRVVWKAELSSREPLELVVGELLANMRLRLWTRPTVIAAVGPAHAQLRKLTGLPPVSDRAALAQVVAESAGRFFLRNGVPLVTSGVRREGASEGWSAALEQPVVAALETACRACRLRLMAVYPTMAVLPSVLRGDSLSWRDGEIQAQVECEGGRLRSARRAYAIANERCVEVEPAAPVAALSALGADGWRFADAYGAAIASASDPLAHRPARSSRGVSTPRWRFYLAGAVLVASIGALAGVPALLDERSATRDARALAQLAKRRSAAMSAESDLMRVSSALNEVAAFNLDRRSMSLFIRDISRLMPVGSAIVALHADSVGGTLVALAPRAAVLIAKLEDIPGLSAPTIVGPVTREVAAGAEVERVTLRFRWSGTSVVTSTPKSRP